MDSLNAMLKNSLKVRLHGATFVESLVQFSPLDRCERVNQLRMFRFREHAIGPFVIDSLVHINQKEKVVLEIMKNNSQRNI